MKSITLSRVRTDLAIESAEYVCGLDHKMPGVDIKEVQNEWAHIRVTHVHIKNQEGEKQLGKPVGRYITLETPYLADADENYHKEITKVLMEQLEMLIPDIKRKKVLVVGVGNRDITPDALGPKVVDHLMVTRHLLLEYGRKTSFTKNLGMVSAIAPGVMAQTGMEGREVIAGVVKETSPDVLIVIDALAARSISRLNTTIQLTDTGISPGAGVGNQRHGLNKKTLGIPVIAIGIPTVIDAATIVIDTFESLMGNLESDEQEMFMQQVLTEELCSMFVTPKDIDETISKISFTISEAINSLCHAL